MSCISHDSVHAEELLSLLANVEKEVHQLMMWDCQLMFSDSRCESGVVDLLDYVSQLSYRSTVRSESELRYTDELGYYFDESKFFGCDGEVQLKEAIKAAARAAGYELFVRNKKTLAGTNLWSTEIRFTCNRNKVTSSRKLDHLQLAMDNGNVILPGCKRQKLRQHRNKSGNIVKQSCSKRRTWSTRPSQQQDCCQFRIVVVLHCTSQRWYVKLLSGCSEASFRRHYGHHKLCIDHIASTTTMLSDADLEAIKKYTELHFSPSQAALLLSTEGRFFLPSQLAWLSKKAIQPCKLLSPDASSAERLLAYLDSQSDITWVSLIDRRGERSGLVVTTNKGRPMGQSRCETFMEDKNNTSIMIRQSLGLQETQSILLAIGWITDDEKRLVSLYPEVLFMDVTSQTNNEKRGLFLVAGKDSTGSAFTATRMFLPSEQKWVFHWIFKHALPLLLGTTSIKRNSIVITDGDCNIYDSLNDETTIGGIWEGTQHFLCFWHLLTVSWAKDIKPFTKNAEVSQLVHTAYSWIRTWFYEIETIEEFQESLSRLNDWLLKEQDKFDAVVGAIQELIVKKLLPHQKRFLRCNKIHLRCFDEVSNSVCESQNSSIKRGVMRVVPKMSIATTAQLLTDKSKVTMKYRDARNARKLTGTSLWSTTATAGLITEYADGLITGNFERNNQYNMVQVNLCTWILQRKRRHFMEEPIIPKYNRLRKVWCEDDFLFCSCKYYERMGLPCVHILKVTNCVQLTMCDVRWWKSYNFHYLNHGHITEAFDAVIAKRSIGVPWKLPTVTNDLSFPILSPDTTYDDSITMLSCYNNSMTMASSSGTARKTDVFNVVGVQMYSNSSNSFDVEDSFTGNVLHSMEQRQPMYQDLFRKFETIYHLAETDAEQLLKLEQQLDCLHQQLLQCHRDKFGNIEGMKLVSSQPEIDKSHKSKNNCRY